MAHPDIEGLVRMLDGGGHLIEFQELGPDDVDVLPFIPSYECDSGSGLIPDFNCPNPGPSSWSDSFAITGTSIETTFGVVPDDLDPPPDLALVEIEFALRFSPYTVGCKIEPDHGCATPALGYGEADMVAAMGASVGDSQPAGLPSYNTHVYDPARDPDYFDGFDFGDEVGPSWQQGGLALMPPPFATYSDPDPTDPNLPYVPFLWRWEDVIGQTVTFDASGDTWHEIRGPAGGPNAWRVVITPYQYVDAAPTVWMHVL